MVLTKPVVLAYDNGGVYGILRQTWFHDYVAYWAGCNGYIWHSKSSFRSPAFEGDVTFIDGEVIDKIDACSTPACRWWWSK